MYNLFLIILYIYIYIYKYITYSALWGGLSLLGGPRPKAGLANKSTPSLVSHLIKCPPWTQIAITQQCIELNMRVFPDLLSETR